MRKSILYAVALVALLMSYSTIIYAGDDKKRVVLQAFWWDYHNNNFEESYANYLTELAPRLKELGVNAVWIPPFCKASGTNNVGYGPFDQYDLGDKYQKGRGSNRDAANQTRMGTKDDLLRMIAVMHANGIEVICDMVLNHTTDPGGEDGGAGGKDPMARDDQWKNFRYVCYKTPYKDGGETDYLSREGRWPKNWPNFHPNTGHDCNDGDWCSSWWGPDICYMEGAYGQSSNAIYNPKQGKNYMRDNARSWAMWLKKQTAVDGFRWDAVKHFPEFVQQDISYNLKYVLPDWAQGGEDMFNIGEFIDGKGRIDQYTTDVQYANGGDEFLMGAFDCPLHYGIQSITEGGGYADMGSVVNSQLNRRYVTYGDGHKVHRSTNYINSHDNFRPTLDENGNYIDDKWGSDMGGPIHPNNYRLGIAYATIAALDGNVCVFMEDLFNLNNSNRWTHHPSSKEELPVRDAIKNIIWCHQNLNFKWGDYKVRHQDSDLLIVERSGRALICITDDGGKDNYHNQWVKTDFAPGTVLKDYSGGAGGNPVVNDDGWVELYVHPVTSQKAGRGYAIWAPEGAGGYAPYRSKTTVQEWEMADDLGDSHCNSLGQGGALPTKSTAQRLVGKIYAAKGAEASFHAYMASDVDDVTLAIYDLDGNLLAKENGVKEFTLDYTPETDGWIAMKIWNNSKDAEGGKAYVRVSYQAPATVKNTMTDKADTRASIWTGNMGTTAWIDCGNWEQGKVPTSTSTVVIPDNGNVRPTITGKVTVNKIVIERGSGSDTNPDILVSGSLTVSESTECKGGTAYICGDAELGSISGQVEDCSATYVDDEESDAGFSVFPSPAQEYITITSPTLKSGNIAIYNVTGQAVMHVTMQQTIEKVDVSKLASGVYIVTDGYHQQRVVKGE